MEYVFKFFKWLLVFTNATIGFCTGIPGMILIACTAFGVPIVSLARDFLGACTSTVTIFAKAQDAVSELMSVMSSSQYFGFFYNCFALDEFGRALSLFLVLVIALIVLSAFEMFFQCVVVAVPFLIYRSIGKIVQAASAGFVKIA